MSMTFGADAATGARPASAAQIRPSFRDVLDDLLSDHEETAVPGLDGLDRLLKAVAAPARREGPPAPQAASAQPALKTERPAPRLAVLPASAPQAPRAPRRKTTQYLLEDIFARLEQAREVLEGFSAGGSRRISKSGIVNAALSLTLAELETRGEHSRLARTVLRGTKPGPTGKE
jgi:hypothetical protein